MKRFGPIIFAVFLQSFVLVVPAQANHKEVNGCGDAKGLGNLVPNQPVGVDFRPICDNHDRCYGTLNNTKQDCDNNFRSQLRAKCEKTLLRSAGGIFATAITSGGALASCYVVAEAYYRGVQAGGQGAYDKTQAHAREEQASIDAATPDRMRAPRMYKSKDGPPEIYGISSSAYCHVTGMAQLNAYGGGDAVRFLPQALLDNLRKQRRNAGECLDP